MVFIHAPDLSSPQLRTGDLRDDQIASIDIDNDLS
jgi:hypothetical protein